MSLSEEHKLEPGQLQGISAPTIEHYESDAEGFWLGTRDHDVRQNMDALIRALEGSGPHHILDLGCGPGRDLMAFQRLGYKVTGLDGCSNFCAMARRMAGCTVLHQDFLALDLEANSFDGIFANASLFHVPAQELPRVLGDLHASLKPGGILFSSNPRGDNREGWNGERYGSYHDLEQWQRYLNAAGFTEVEHYYRPPGLPREQQPWLASVWRRPG